MPKSSLLLSLAILITLTEASISTAGAVIQTSSSSNAANVTPLEEPITLETPTGTLFGTLARPQSRSRLPVVLIIAGSGPTDRDGNSPLLKGANNSLKMLAHGLASLGIASVRYDKRGVGETGKAMQLAAEKAKTTFREEDLSFETYIDDAEGWGRRLRADRRFSSLVVLGHSEGSLIGMVAAQRLGAEAFVSIAGAGRSIQEVILEQVRPSFTPDLLKTTESILEQLAGGKRVDSVPPELHMLFRPSVQPYMISWLRYDPSKEISKLRMPVLIVHGSTDLQISLNDMNGLARGNPKARVLTIEGMNHVLKIVSNERDQQIASYSDPTLPVAPGLIDAVVAFVKGNRRG